ncbi:rhamnulokinase [Evansella caseinilytica]|uniref:Rhamnulokinase n=1 Tax=Evansella caseinilytica TaxID=1503961 RepID=A0A1H3TH22_9BACI|nr:rhamnulokinase [Evansella caseinilytica]SDZ48629.1 rhamnulokinase [Evansella caseinilytica]
MKKHCLAVDIGASSGRLMLGCLENRQLELKEIYRFENQMIQLDGQYCWDIDRLFAEIKTGISRCVQAGVQPDSIGIDTWAVDFVLLDEQDRLLTKAVAYRDARTDGMMEKVFRRIPKEALYAKTGIQFLKFNTIYQLYSLKQSEPETLEKAAAFLMIPDYLHFLLTGKKVNEYTNATSTQLVNAKEKNWDEAILAELGISRSMFQQIAPPKTILGNLTAELVKEFGSDMQVVLPATHDTGSAVAAVPDHGETIYLSSGTWSLIGVESAEPNSTAKALDYNYTNEGGIDYRYRFLKNIMGLWMIQEVKRNYHDHYSFSELVDLAREASDYSAIVNVNDDRFLNPVSMVAEIQDCCRETDQPVPTSPGEVAKCVYDSLAVSYQQAVEEIEDILGKTYAKINVIGGGCQNEMLNQLIADVTNKEVNAGPVEATAIGNIVAQLMALGEMNDIEEARAIVQKSFAIKKYFPRQKMN